jgi:hypothetical protein
MAENQRQKMQELSACSYLAVVATGIRAAAVRIPGVSPVSVHAKINSSPNRAIRG